MSRSILARHIVHSTQRHYAIPTFAHLRHFASTSMSNQQSLDDQTAQAKRTKDLQELLSKFRNPQSPYYIAPGTSGPAHPEDHANSHYSEISPPRSPRQYVAEDDYDTSREQARIFFQNEGFDLKGRLEWPVAWGDCDMFKHANNVQYLRWLESARIQYCESLELPPKTVENMLQGKGTGFILKDVSVKYRSPVTYPDILVIATRPHDMHQERASFGLSSAFYSLKQNKLVATADSTLVMYDYDNLKKGQMSDEFRDVLRNRLSRSVNAEGH